MTDFWLFAVVMLFVASVFVLVPLIRFKNVQQKDQIAASWYESRLAELEKEFQAGQFSQQEYDTAVKELKLTATHELQTITPRTLTNKKAKPYLMAALVILLGVVSISYFKQGHYGKLQAWQQTMLEMPDLTQKVIQNSNEPVTREELQNFALGLRTKLLDKDEAIGWMLLGRTLRAMNDIDGAVDAFAKSYERQPNSVSNIISYAQTLQAKGEDYDIRKSLRLLQQAMNLQPQNDIAVLLFAEGNMMLEEFETAKQVFEYSLTLMANDDPKVAIVNERLQWLNGGLDDKQSGGEQTQSLTIEVAGSKELLETNSTFTHLFVFARIPGSPVPVAVKKLPFTGLPLTVNLSDADSMLPEVQLSQQEIVNVFARLSTDDQAPAITGDWQGRAEQVNTQGSIKIMINEEVK